MIFKEKLFLSLFAVLAFICNILNKRILLLLSKGIGAVLYFFIPIRKKTVIENLSIAFPEKNKKEISKIALKNYQHVIYVFLNVLVLHAASEEKIKKTGSIENIELIKSKLKENKGLFFYTGHFGSWEHSAFFAGLILNQRFNVLAKEQSNKLVFDFINSIRERFGNKVIKIGLNIRELFGLIKNREIIGIVADQRGDIDGRRVQFFNKQTAIFDGSQIIAVKLKVPILVGFNVLLKDGNFKLFVEEIDYCSLNALTPEAEVDYICQEYFSKLEKYIKLYPEQWFWMHKIWKY